jgi:hypothetical protein
MEQEFGHFPKYGKGSIAAEASEVYRDHPTIILTQSHRFDIP